MWFVYIARCSDNSFYTGITTDLNRRIKEHNGIGRGGAKYTKTRRPVIVMYWETVTTRSEALIRERKIKQLSRTKKEFLMSSKKGAS